MPPRTAVTPADRAGCEVTTDPLRLRYASDGSFGSTRALVTGKVYGLNVWGPSGEPTPASCRVEVLVRAGSQTMGDVVYQTYRRATAELSQVQFDTGGAKELQLLFALAEAWIMSLAPSAAIPPPTTRAARRRVQRG